MSSSLSFSETPVQTYEATKASLQTQRQPDKIHWSDEWAYRESQYRQLHHQQGLVGKFRIQLLEACDLERSYWSPLALIPGVQHLSKAHGAISSFCQVSLTSAASDEEEWEERQTPQGKPLHTKTSPVIAQDNHPVWTNCVMELDLRKGQFADGRVVQLQVDVLEDASGVEQVMQGSLPLLVSSPQDRLLGRGQLSLTPLLLGESVTQRIPGVMDVWIPITKDTPHHGKKEEDKTKASPPRGNKPPEKDDDDEVLNKCTGRVRVLISYHPHGMTPRPHDLVALEGFARRPPGRSSCPPILSPLSPLKVLQVGEAHLLVEYIMGNHRTPSRHNNNNKYKAALRLPRNAVFCIERTNLVDGAVNLALLPTDIFFSTPLGRTTKQVAGPVVAAAGEVAMPALLTAKLALGAVKTAGWASWSGVHAATSAVIQTSREAHHHFDQQQSFARPAEEKSEGGGDSRRRPPSTQTSFV